MSNYSTREVEEVIANGRRLVAEAEEALAQTDRFFSEHNIKPEDSLEFVREHGGEAAVQAVQAQVAAALQRIDEAVERQRMHGPKPRQPGRRPRTRNNMV
jgi:hypothetical protein